MLASARGELKTLSLPNLSVSPFVAVKTPPFFPATSSPYTSIFGLTAISSASAWLTASTMTTEGPGGGGGAALPGRAGAAGGAYTNEVSVETSGRAFASAHSAAASMRACTSVLMRVQSDAVSIPFSWRYRSSRGTGSRLRSSSRSRGSLYFRWSSEEEWARRRTVSASMTLGPSPRLARATASDAASNIAGKSHPSTWYLCSPPYPLTIPDTDSPASWSLTGTEIANRLF